MGELVPAPGSPASSVARQFSVPVSTSDLGKILAQLHPDIARILPDLHKYLECYEGDNISAFLFKHLRENTGNFTERRKRAYYYNYCASIVDTYVSFLFRKPIVRTIKGKTKRKLVPIITPPPPEPGQVAPGSAPPQVSAPASAAAAVPSDIGSDPDALTQMPDKDYQAFHKDVDGRGTPISDWMRTTSLYTNVFGMLGVVVDMPKLPEELDRDNMSEKDRVDNKITPYLTRIFPTNIINWELDDQGVLLWIRYREDPPSQLEPFVPRDLSQRKIHYRTWTREGWKLHEVVGNSIQVVDEGTHDLGKVPFVMVYNKQSLKNQWLGVSALASISAINIGIFNWCSLIDEHLYQKCLSILAIKKRIEDEEEVVIGNNNILEYTADKAPEFISPSSDPEKFIQEQTKEAVRQIYRIARLGGATGLQEPRESTSGVAYAFEFNETNNLLADKADLMEQAEREIHWLIGKWLNKGSNVLDNIVIDYPEDFGLDDVNGEMTVLATVQDRMTSDTFKREVQKRLLKRILPKIDNELLHVILQEIDLNPAAPPPMMMGGGFGAGKGAGGANGPKIKEEKVSAIGDGAEKGATSSNESG